MHISVPSSGWDEEGQSHLQSLCNMCSSGFSPNHSFVLHVGCCYALVIFVSSWDTLACINLSFYNPLGSSHMVHYQGCNWGQCSSSSPSLLLSQVLWIPCWMFHRQDWLCLLPFTLLISSVSCSFVITGIPGVPLMLLMFHFYGVFNLNWAAELHPFLVK